jgi:hypothetical protein
LVSAIAPPAAPRDHGCVRRALLVLLACAALAGAPAGAGSDALGPALDPNRLEQLPREGLTVQVGSRVVVATTRGRVIGHLDRYKIAEEAPLDQLAPGPRPLMLFDSIGDGWQLRGGKLVEWQDSLRLAGGASLVRVGQRWTFRGARIGFVSERRDLVTLFGPRSARVVDVRSGRSTTIARGCRAAARRGSRWFLLCGYPFGDPKAASTVQLREPGGALRALVGPAERGARPMGWWTAAFLSADGSRLLLQWSGLCEIPVAFFARSGGGTPRPVTGEAALSGAPDSIALGWSGRRALVDLPRLGCGSGIGKSGVYLIDPVSGQRTWAYRSSRFWRSLN